MAFQNNPYSSNPFSGMDLQQLGLQQQLIQSAIQQEQYRQQSMQRMQQQNNYRNPPISAQLPLNDAGLSGRLIEDISEIKPSEVAMDGRVSIFPKKDYSSIVAKAWNANGTIDTVEYIPKPQEHPSNENAQTSSTNDIGPIFASILERLDNIEKMLNNRNNYNKTNNRPNNKKESAEDEQPQTNSN